MENYKLKTELKLGFLRMDASISTRIKCGEEYTHKIEAHTKNSPMSHEVYAELSYDVFHGRQSIVFTVCQHENINMVSLKYQAIDAHDVFPLYF